MAKDIFVFFVLFRRCEVINSKKKKKKTEFKQFELLGSQGEFVDKDKKQVGSLSKLEDKVSCDGFY